MKNFSALLLALIVLLFFTQCSDDESDDDLTATVVGLYTETGGDATITVNKVDNNTVSITVDDDYWDFAFTDVTMNSSTAFTLNTYTRDGESCSGTETISGTGTASNNNISLFITIDGEGTAPYAACGDDTYNVSGSK